MCLEAILKISSVYCCELLPRPNYDKYSFVFTILASASFDDSYEIVCVAGGPHAIQSDTENG
jgi:hypothetical protein